MKKFLLSENGNFYKVNLHCHSTISDGKLTPAEIKEAYLKKGYSAVAFTDHEVFLQHNDLTDENFVALNGVELAVNEVGRTSGSNKCCHICMVALSPDTKQTVCWHREKYLFRNAPLHKDEVVFDESLPDYERVFTPECINDMIQKGKDGGFFVTYNHPVWSLETYEDYMKYEGMHAMEIANFGCLEAGFDDYNAKVYDDMLRGGKRLFCIGADDNHNKFPLDHERCDSFGAWVCVKADSLTYKNLTDALLAGDFYASRGPEIKELWYEDGKVHVTCSPVKQISLHHDKRRISTAVAPKGEYLTEAVLEVLEGAEFFRLSLTDEYHLTADTNTYYVNELK